MPPVLTDWVPFPEELGLSGQQQKLIHLLYLGYPMWIIPKRLNSYLSEHQVKQVVSGLCARLGLEMPPSDPWQRLANWRAKMIGAVEYVRGQRSERGLTHNEEARLAHAIRHPKRKLGPRPKFVDAPSAPPTDG